MEFLKTLNSKQFEAVNATEGYVRVIAGAGSGKTKLLVGRYAYLVLDYGIDSSNILCVTFTNKAAAEMKKRIRDIIGGEHDTTLICTYHGFCARLLRENPEKLFLNKGFQIIDTSQQKAILEEIYQKYELKLDHASFENILKLIALEKKDSSYVPSMCNPAPCQILPTVETINQKIIEDFLQRQKAIYALDFHDLLNFAIYLLEKDEDIREKWQSRLNYIMVDEFQDSSSKEMKLIDILSNSYKNLMIVGDPDQNIYEWRGSDVKLLVDFDKGHAGCQTIFLNQNYRSTPQILQCANFLIDKNEMRLKKDLFTLETNGTEVYHYHSKSDSEETDIISDTIKKLVKSQKYKYSDIAILYRSSFLSRIVEKKLVESGIPYEIFGGVKFFRRMEVLDVIAYLRLIEFDDDLSFKRIINTPRRKFGRGKMTSLETLRENEISIFMESESSSLYSTLKNHIGDSVFRNSGVGQFVSFIDNLRENKSTMRISQIVEEVCMNSGYEQYIRELGDEERLENLAELKRIASEFESNYGEEISLSEFLQLLALQSAEDEEKGRDTVKLMTIHSSKGLEFPVVFIVGLSEGIFPSAKTIEERKQLGLEEERRLCYVAITRAKERLFLMDSEGFSQNGTKKLPSRFLDEIGAENYKRIGVIDDELLREAKGYINRTNKTDVKDSQKSVGESVDHHIFGKGVVVAKNESKGSLVVKFDKFSQPRTLSNNYFSSHEMKTLDSHKDASITEVPLSKSEKNEESDTLNTEFEAQERIIAALPKLENNKGNNDPEPQEQPSTRESMIDDAALQEKLANTPNLWKRDDVPHEGWYCVGVTDLGAPCGVCEMCGYQIIRYVHHMVHNNYSGTLNVGCICAGKMEGDIEKAKKRERDFKNRESRRENFMNRKWNKSKNGNPYIKIKNHIIVLYKKKGAEIWKYSIDNEFCPEIFKTQEEAMQAVFEALEQLANARS